MVTSPATRNPHARLIKAASSLSIDELKAILASRKEEPMFNRIRTATETVRKILDSKESGETAITTAEEKRVEKALTLAQAHFSDGHMKGIVHILAALMDVDIKKYSDFIPSSSDSKVEAILIPGAMLVMIKNAVSHDYGTHPFIVRHSSRNSQLQIFDDKGVMHKNLVTGNTLPNDVTHYRAATATEVEDVLAKMKENGALVDKILGCSGLDTLWK